MLSRIVVFALLNTLGFRYPNAQGAGMYARRKVQKWAAVPGGREGSRRAPGLNFVTLSHFPAASLTNMPGERP